MIILAHDRREIVQFDVTQHPTAAWLSQQVIEAFPWDTAVPSQKLNPDILMMKPAEDWYRCDAADLLRTPKFWNVLI